MSAAQETKMNFLSNFFLRILKIMQGRHALMLESWGGKKKRSHDLSRVINDR